MLNALARKSSAMLGALAMSAAMAGEAGQEVPPGYEEGLPILRFQKDAARDRGWILTQRGVLVFELKTRRTIAQVSLPEWTWAEEAYICLPDLALGPKGEALVSSNVVPALWRVDPVSLAVTRHALRLDAHQDKDVGFTGLTFSAAQGAFYAVSHFGALWRIDPLLTRAQKIDLSAPITGACGVASRTRKQGFNRFVGLCVRGEKGGWTVNLAPDRRSGYVIDRACPA